MLEFDGQALDPAIVSAQPMKPVPTVDLQQMGCAASEPLSISEATFQSVFVPVCNQPCVSSSSSSLRSWPARDETSTIERGVWTAGTLTSE